MNQRIGRAERRSNETSVKVEINLEGQGLARIDTGIGFFDHMLTILAGHSGFDLTVECSGDLNVDGHHTVEDVGIVLGRAFAQALGDKSGISRYGTSFVPMDESLAMVSLDISGRPLMDKPRLPLRHVIYRTIVPFRLLWWQSCCQKCRCFQAPAVPPSVRSCSGCRVALPRIPLQPAFGFL